MTRIAINIVTWNSSAYLHNCLNAVYAQTLTDFSVTVIDNSSQDSSIEIARQWEECGLRLIRNPDNAGYAKAHNQGIASTDSEFVLTLNPDVILSPPFLQTVIETISAMPKVGSAAGKLLRISTKQFQNIDALNGTLSGYRIDSAGLIMRRSRRQALMGYLEDAAANCNRQIPIFGPDGAAALYRRDMLEDTALNGECFDEMLNTHKEDVDLAWRAQLMGWDSVFVPQAIAYHVRGFRPRESWFFPWQRRVVPAEVRYAAVRNRWMINVKNDLLALFVRDLPNIASYDLAILVYIILFEQRSLLAMWDFFKVLPEMQRRRHIIQSRRVRDAEYMARWFV